MRLLQYLKHYAFTHEQLLFLYYNNASFNRFVEYMRAETLRRYEERYDEEHASDKVNSIGAWQRNLLAPLPRPPFT